MRRCLILFAVLGCMVSPSLGETRATETEATITSDEMEIQQNGARVVFRGHVRLAQTPYLILADRMVQTKETGVVDAYGKVEGHWQGTSGEKITAVGRRARYYPNPQHVELWGNAKVTRTEAAPDAIPVTMNAERFKAYHEPREVWAENNVHLQQGKGRWVRADRARYMEASQEVHFWGPSRVRVHWEDLERGQIDLEGDRGIVTLDPKGARLLDRVQGHIIPKPS